MTSAKRSIGCVVIGRNEGARLAACLKSVESGADCIVYVDSGSHDGSPGVARLMGVDTLVLDDSVPFTAARGRNAGLERLLRICPAVDAVQFVDGDCELFPSWFQQARNTLEEHSDVAVVFGRLRERHPERSVYNRLCDIEWNTPPGDAMSCGGIAMMRVRALREAGVFDEGLIAGEEPELCFRLREKGWKILCIEADMGWHDAAMTRFRQWFKRSIRTGHAYAEVSRIVGDTPGRFWVHERRSIEFWGLLVPATALFLAGPTGLGSLWLMTGYGALLARVYQIMRRRGTSRMDSAAYSFFCTLGKFPQAWGVLSHSIGAISGQRRGLIEYK